jgi:hypothetical protein
MWFSFICCEIFVNDIHVSSISFNVFCVASFTCSVTNCHLCLFQFHPSCVVHKKDDVVNFIHLVVFHVNFCKVLKLESDHGHHMMKTKSYMQCDILRDL